MRTRRLQNKIAESRFALTVTAAVCLFIWFIAGLAFTPSGWNMTEIINNPVSILRNNILITIPSMTAATYLMVELNNTNALIRIYSRMVSCTFLVMITMLTFQYTSIDAAIITLCAVGFYTPLFHAYQDKLAAGRVYFAFLFMGIASIFFIQAIFFMPLMLILMATKIQAMSARSLTAAFLGILTPYWFMVGYYVATSSIESMTEHFSDIIRFGAIADLRILSIQQIVSGIYLLLCALTGGIHYLRTRQQDRIRTQMLYESIIIVDSMAFIFLLLQPNLFEKLSGIIIVNTAPLIAHFIALTETKWTNILTILLILLAVIITLFNLWMPSLTF